MKTDGMKFRRCPWGKVQTTSQIAPGILKCTTASHGGYYLSAEVNSLIPELLREATFGRLGQQGWYEEDLDWAIVVASLPANFDEALHLAAIKSLEVSHREPWRAVKKLMDSN